MDEKYHIPTQDSDALCGVKTGGGFIAGTIDFYASQICEDCIRAHPIVIKLKKERDSALRIARIVDLDERYVQTKALQDKIARGD